MKKALSALLAIAAIQAPLIGHASDGTITFTGSLIPTTCTVTNGGATALDIKLQPVATSSLTPSAPTAGDTIFSLDIANCDKNTATAHFETGPINKTSGRLTNTSAPASGPANVELQLLNGDGSVINLGGAYGAQSVSAAPVDATTKTAKANFAVRYYLTDGVTPIAGAVTSNVTYTMIYL